MSSNASSEIPKRIMVQYSKLTVRERVEQVKEMKYLRTMISSDGSMDSKVEQRVGMASRMVGATGSTVLGRKELGKGDKIEGGECYGDSHIDLWV